jgi:hypothetical protein
MTEVPSIVLLPIRWERAHLTFCCVGIPRRRHPYGVLRVCCAVSYKYDSPDGLNQTLTRVGSVIAYKYATLTGLVEVPGMRIRLIGKLKNRVFGVYFDARMERKWLCRGRRAWPVALPLAVPARTKQCPCRERCPDYAHNAGNVWVRLEI